MCCDRHLEIPGVSNNTTGTLEQKKTNSWTPVGQTLNLIQDAVLNALKMPKMMSLCRVLGIIYVSITEPYWEAVLKPNISAIEMGPVYNRLVDCLDKWAKDIEPLLEGKEYLNINEMPVHGDHAYLFKETEEQELVKKVLKEMCIVLSEKSRKLFDEFLKDGKFCSPIEDQINKAKSCPSHNISMERLMAQTDRSMSMAPNSNKSTRESKIIYTENKTGEWIGDKSSDNQKRQFRKL